MAEKWWQNYAGIIFGALLSAISLNMFSIPNKIAPGGVSGLATILHYVLGMPVGITMLALNIPLFLFSVRVLGKKFGLNTLFGAVVLSVAIDVVAPYVPVLTNDLLLASLYGGILDGVGLGLVFRFKGTTAGTDLAAAVINKLFGISVGQALLYVDFFVIVTAGVVFGKAELSLYALISLFVATQIIDLVQEGRSSAKLFFIMTTKIDQVAHAIMNDLGRGVTLFRAIGGYTGQPREVLFCVVSTGEVSKVKDLVLKYDDRAFVIVSDAHEVMGEGFTRSWS